MWNENTSVRGMSYPATRDTGGPFTSKLPPDAAWGDAMNALLTPIGSRLMRRSFGSDLLRLLYEPNVEQHRELVDYTVRQTLGRYCPHIRVFAVNVTGEGRTVKVDISFSVAGDGTVEHRSLAVPITGDVNAQFVAP
jgi:phage baseplate assembly protein W